MHRNKGNEFNPLDILATAAALKQTDTIPKQKIVVVKPKHDIQIIKGIDLDNNATLSERNKSALKKTIGVIKSTSLADDGLKQYKFLINPELEKMLHEHNYGSVKKTNTDDIQMPDVLSCHKDKKVIIKVISRKGQREKTPAVTNVNDETVKDQDNHNSLKETESLSFNVNLHINEEDCQNISLNNTANETSPLSDICKPSSVDLIGCKEHVDKGYSSFVSGDIDVNKNITLPKDETNLTTDSSDNQTKSAHCEDIVLTSGNSVQDKILNIKVENQYSDNETPPGKIDTGANNTNRCDTGKSQSVNLKIETSVQEKDIRDNSNSEQIFGDRNLAVPFPMQDHEYAGRFIEEPLKGNNKTCISVDGNSSQIKRPTISMKTAIELEKKINDINSPSADCQIAPSFNLSDDRDALVALVKTKEIQQDTINQNNSIRTSPKCGRFSIGKFASVCNSSLGLELPEESPTALEKRISPSFLSRNNLEQTKNKRKTSNVSGCQHLIQYIEHDHDYCLPLNHQPANIPISVQKAVSETTSKHKTRDKKSDTNEKRTKHLSISESINKEKLVETSPIEDDTNADQNDKLSDILKNNTSESKLKIQGSYKDDFVYFLNTNFRSRRRASNDVQAPLATDKIILPIPKPGDIVVPHLTNEDLEAIKLGKHHLLSTGQQLSSPVASQKAIVSPSRHQSNGTISDMESRIINTILSMENEPCVDSADTGTFNTGNFNFNWNFSDQLTPEQMEMLYSAVDQVQSIEVKSDNHSSRQTEQQHTVTDSNKDDPVAVNCAAAADKNKVLHNSARPTEHSTKKSEQVDIFGQNIKLFQETSEQLRVDPDQGGDNAPWIVTVSMYWNDLPAIMLDNLPYLRLVDIHKQILPAKDTGILKKRCQLLGVDVKNCSEMQRYFLVQYGKAFNSKSNLIISKEDAETLVGYYVNPVSKLPRSVDYQTKNKMKRTSRIKAKPPVIEKRKMQQTTISQVAAPFTDHHLQEPLGRTRHKKINFLELLKGDSNNNSSENSCIESKQQKSVSSHITSTVMIVDPPSESLILNKSDVNKQNIKHSKIADVKQTKDSRKLETKNVHDKTLTWLSKNRQKPFAVDRKSKKPGFLKVKWTVFNKIKRKKWPKARNRRNVLAVSHRDVFSNNSQLNNIQTGNVFMDLYNNENSPCIRCCTCTKVFSVDDFLEHLHDNRDDGKLISVVNPQTLSLRDTSESQKKMWQSFQLKRKNFNNNSSTQQLNSIQQSRARDFKELPQTVKPIDKSIRISSRKRRQKQLYPIENYSFCSTVKSDEEITATVQLSPAKIVKVTHSSNTFPDNFVTGSKGPNLDCNK